MSKVTPPKVLDEKKLLQLQPPLRVSVVKRYFGGRGTPIPMPPAKLDANWAAGEGYDHNDVRTELPKTILRKAGGGNYSITVTDEQGGIIEYEHWFDTTQFPDLIPPEHVEAAQRAPQTAPQAQVIQLPQQQPVQQVAPVVMAAAAGGGPPIEWSSYVPAGLPRGAIAQAVLPGTVVQAPGYSYPAAAPAQPSGVMIYERPAAAAAPSSTASPDLDLRLRQLEKENQALRETNLQKENQSARERELGALRDELKELRKIADRPAAPPRDEETSRALVALADAVRDLRQTRDADAAKASSDRQMEMFMRMMERMDQNSREAQQRAEQAARENQARQEQLLLTLTARPQGPDPTMTTVIEFSRQNAEMSREMVRATTEASKERDRNALTMRDVVDMQEKMNAQNGAHSLLKGVSEAYQSVFSMAKMASEMIAGMDKSSSGPGMELLGTAVQRVTDVAQGFIQMKRDTSIGESRAREAEARAHATAAMVGGGARLAPAPAQPGQPHVQVPPAGPAVPLAVVPSVVQTAQEPVRTMTAVQAQMAEQEMKLFGPALEQVNRLRLGVNAGKVTPEHAVQWIFQARSIIAEKGWKVDALLLFESDQLGMFLDVLLPDAPKEFVRTLGALLAEAKQRGGPPLPGQQPAAAPPTEDPDDPDEDGGDDDLPHSN
jgi:hypothetical protein